MPEQKKTPQVDVSNVQTLFINQANVTASYSDIRLYLSESSPRHVTLGAVGTPTETFVTPKICAVMSPEFAMAIRDALTTSIDRYENQFGKIRIKPGKPSE